ncbi:XRE family transcriptional regulator [Erysipelothrix rhusiopathiae]|nr:XRE family transcriptional regulator [Erysipelothrix rhusiopathiae]
MRLKKIRESRGFTQDHIARKLCVTRQAISRWENEKNTTRYTISSQIIRVI